MSLPKLVSQRTKPIDTTRPIVLIPAYNEAGSIGKVVSDLAHLQKQGIVGHIVVVDDGSKDRTGDIALMRGADTVIRLNPNSGKAQGFFEGVKYCFAHLNERQVRTAKLILLDADLKGITEHQIRQLIEPLGAHTQGKGLPSIGMVIGTVGKGAMDQTLSGQRAFSLAGLKPIITRPQLQRRLLGSTEHRRGYGLETFLNYYFTHQRDIENLTQLVKAINPNPLAHTAAIVPTEIKAGMGSHYAERPGRTTVDNKRFLEEIWGADIYFADRNELARKLIQQRRELRAPTVSTTEKQKLLEKMREERKKRVLNERNLLLTLAPQPQKQTRMRKH